MGKLTHKSRSVAGKVVLVTGAASGMGRAVAHLFADEGAKVAVTDRDGAGAARVSAEITDAGGTASAFVLDVADVDAVESVVTQVADELGQVDVLVNNAGVSAPAPLGAEHYESAWDDAIAVNLSGAMRLCRACFAQLGRTGEGRIVNIASTEGLGSTAGLSAYSVSKHGVVGLTRALAVELGPLGITVNCVCPGPVHTAMTAPIPDDAKERFAHRRVPLRRYGDPEEVAHMVLNLALPSSSYVNGAIVPVDGGLVAMQG
jgi:3-oxoacyl-[acyl-carrier protein] reductase